MLCPSPKLYPRRKSLSSLLRQLEENSWMGSGREDRLPRERPARGHTYIKDGGKSAFRNALSMRVKPPDHSGDASHPVSPERELDQKP